MSGPINPDGLAIVLAGTLHPGAQVTPATKLAASRIRDVLGIQDGDPVYGYEISGAKAIERLIAAALLDAKQEADQ